MKKLLAMVLSLCIVFTCSSVAFADRLDDIKAKGKIVVGTEVLYAPFEFYATDENGNEYAAGFEMEMVRKIAADIGVEVELVDQSFTSLITGLRNGDFDMIVGGFLATEERKEVVDFANPYRQGAQIMVVREEDLDTYTTKDSLKGKVIGAQVGALQQTIAEEQFPEPEYTHLLLDKVPVLLMDLQAGNVDGVLCADLVAKMYILKYDGLAISQVPVEYEDVGVSVAVRKSEKNDDNTTLMESINASIKEVVESGQFDQWVDDAVALQVKMSAE